MSRDALRGDRRDHLSDHARRGFHRPRQLQPVFCVLAMVLILLFTIASSVVAGSEPGESGGAEPYETILVSRATGADGASANGVSSIAIPPGISANGRYVAFVSSATNLDPDDTDSSTDVFVRDRQTNETLLVSRASGADGDVSNSACHQPVISADGRYVAFVSSATNLDPDATNNNYNIFVRDLQTHETILVSRASGADGAVGNAEFSTYNPTISADGRYVGFESGATNLHPDDTDTSADVFVRDLQTHETLLVSRASGAGGLKANGVSQNPEISADGRYIAFDSRATNLHPDDTDTSADVFVRDLQTHETLLVSRASGAGGLKANGVSQNPEISADGRYIAFDSRATNLHPDDTNSSGDIFVRDLQIQETILVSRATGADGDVSSSASGAPAISANGRFVAFRSVATNLHPDDIDTVQDVYMRDLELHQTVLVSRASGADGGKGNGASYDPSISADGHSVAFASLSTNLHPDDTSAQSSVYLRDLTPPGAGGLSFAPPSLDLGEVAVGASSAPLTATLSNTGASEITGLVFGDPGSGFDVDSGDCGASLPGGDSCVIVVTFTPPDFGPFTAVLTATSDQDASASLDLAGIGVGSPEAELSFDPPDLDFGDVEVGASEPLTATLQNTGAGVASGLNFTTLPNAFSVDTSDCGASLGAGESCAVTVTFAPLAPGAVSAELRVLSLEGNSAVLGLGGTGLAPPAPELAFTSENLAFGGVPLGDTSVPLVATLENTGSGDATDLTFTTPGNGFAADTGDCGATLPAGQSCSVTVTYTPGALGGSAATLEVESAEGATATLGAPPPPEQYLYYRIGMFIGGATVRMNPADDVQIASRIVSTPAWPPKFEVEARSCSLYWPAGQDLMRAGLDGADEEILLVTGGEVTDIELDMDAGRLYYAAVTSPTAGASIFRGDISPAGIANVEFIAEIPGGGTGGIELELDPGAGRLYATGRSAGIWSANLDGSNLQLVRDTSAEPRPRALELDLQAGKIYWGDGDRPAEGGDLRIHRANLDGSQYEVALHVPTSQASVVSINYLAVDSTVGKLFWSGGNVPANSANLDGSDITEIVGLSVGGFNFVPGNIDALCGPPPADICPEGAACDRVETIYWAFGNSGGGELWRARADGSYREMLQELAGEPTGIAVSRELGKVYWTVIGDHPASVFRANLDGTDAELVLELPFAPGQYPGGIDLDPATDKMFVVQRGRNGFAPDFDPTKGTLWMADLDGGALEVRAVFADLIAPISVRGQGHPSGPRLDHQERRGYVTANDAIFRFDLDGDAAPEVVVPSLPPDLFPEGSNNLDGTAADLQLDVLRGKLYWRQLFDHETWGIVAGYFQSDLDGTGIQVLPWPNERESFGIYRSGGLAMDAHSRRMYGVIDTHGGSMSRWDVDDGDDLYLIPRIAGAGIGAIALLPAASGGTWATLSLTGEGILPPPPPPPRIDVAPDSLATVLESGSSETVPLTLANLGEVTLDWSVTDGNTVAGRILRPSGGVTLPEALVAPAIVEGLIRSAADGNGEAAIAHPFPAARGDEIVLTHSSSLTIQAANSIACGPQGTGTTVANQFLRSFTLADFDITTDFAVSEVTFGVEILQNVPSASITVNLYTLDGSFIYDNLTLIGSAVEVLTPQQQTLVTVPITGTAPAGSTLVVEIAAPDLSGVGAFFPGSNSLGETAPSYLASTVCGLPEPTPFAQVGSGFPDVHLVMAVSGTVAAPVDCALPDWVDVDPTAGSLPGGSEQTVNVTFDAEGLVAGDYAANLCFASNDPVQPVLPVPLALTVTGGTVVELAFDPTSLDFGDVTIGETSAAIAATLANGGNADATGLMFDISGTDFVVDASNCGDMLAAGASCTVEVTFSPSATGPAGATLTVSSSEGASAGIDLAGNGIESPNADLGVGIAVTHDNLQPGHMADYLVTLDNGGPATATGAGIASVLSPQLDLDFATWLCVGPASSGCTPAGQGDLAETGLEVPVGGSVIWLLSAPVRWDAQGPVETSVTTAYPDDPNPANNSAVAANPVVVYRNGFEPYGMGSEILMMLDEQLTPSVVLTLDWPAPGNTGTVETVFAAAPLPSATNASDAAFRLERFGAGPLSWVRLVAIDDRGAEISGHWLPVTPGTELTLALADTLIADGNGSEADGAVAGDGSVDGNSGEAAAGDGAEGNSDGGEANGGDANGSGTQKLRYVLLMARGGDLQLPLATTPDAYRLWSAIPVTVTPLGN